MRRTAAFRPEATPTGGIHDVIGVMAVELTDLGVCVDDLQDLIGTLADLAGSALSADLIIRLQDIDSVSQRLARLADLAGVLRGAAQGGEPALPSTPELAEALRRLDGARCRPASD